MENVALSENEDVDLDNWYLICGNFKTRFWTKGGLAFLDWSSEATEGEINEFKRDFLLHFYTREIGFETMGQFILKLYDKLSSILPYYNKLFESAKLEFNPLDDVDYTVMENNKNESTGNKHSDSDTMNNRNINGNMDKDIDIRHKICGDERDTTTYNNVLLEKDGQITTQYSHRDKYSDTPQNELPDSSVEDGSYLTNYRYIHDETVSAYNGQPGSGHTGTTEKKSGSETRVKDFVNRYNWDDGNEVTTTNDTITDVGSKESDETTNNTSLDDKMKSVSGKYGNKSYAELLQKYRETIINIKLMMFNECEPLFMGVWL